MVNIDTVYQKVLAICNKEQRGYVTPQEFNLMASKAQLDIYETYFHKMKTSYHKPKNQQGVAFDDIEMIQAKLQPFMVDITNVNIEAESDSIILNTNSFNDSIYKVNTISHLGREIVEVSKKELLTINNNPLTSPTKNRPIYVRETNKRFRVYPLIDGTEYVISYFKKPKDPVWSYVVVNQKALYNFNNAVHFELHPSEEEKIVTRILMLAGVILEKQDLTQAASIDSVRTAKEQNE